MANNNSTTSAVLALPPLDYDYQYFNNLVRVLNFWIQNQQNPGDMRGTGITITDREGKVAFSVNSAAKVDQNVFIMSELPTSATGLAKGQIWVDTTNGNVLKVVM